MKIIGILVAITCLTMSDAAQAGCRTLPDAYQLQRDARALDTTPEQLEIMETAGLLARAAAGFKTAVEELVCRGWSRSQIDAAVRRLVARQASSQLHSNRDTTQSRFLILAAIGSLRRPSPGGSQ